MGRSETDHIQVFQYKRLNNTVSNVLDLCESSQIIKYWIKQKQKKINL